MANLRKTLPPILVFVAILVAGVVTGRTTGLFSGKRPESIGVAAGRLAPCNPSPNCVSSQADRGDATHYIAPIAAGNDPGRTFAEIKRIVRATERVNIGRDDSNYLYAEYRSRFFGFVDDVEFWLDLRAAVIQIRSASRVGYGDLGVNRARIEGIRSQLASAGT